LHRRENKTEKGCIADFNKNTDVINESKSGRKTRLGTGAQRWVGSQNVAKQLETNGTRI
jgi:hypothetical protein